MNQKFHNLFSKEEMKKILDIATLYNDDVIIIHTDKYFFELSAYLSDKVEIYFDNQTTEGRILSKDEFLKKIKECDHSLLNPSRFINIPY